MFLIIWFSEVKRESILPYKILLYLNNMHPMPSLKNLFEILDGKCIYTHSTGILCCPPMGCLILITCCTLSTDDATNGPKHIMLIVILTTSPLQHRHYLSYYLPTDHFHYSVLSSKYLSTEECEKTNFWRC